MARRSSLSPLADPSIAGLTSEDLAANSGQYDNQPGALETIRNAFQARRRGAITQADADYAASPDADPRLIAAHSMNDAAMNGRAVGDRWNGFFGALGAQEAGAHAAGMGFSADLAGEGPGTGTGVGRWKTRVTGAAPGEYDTSAITHPTAEFDLEDAQQGKYSSGSLAALRRLFAGRA